MVRSTGIRLDPGSSEPLYKQLFDQVVARIHSRAYPGGLKLPPSRALAQELGTHRNTVVRAYADLLAAGFVKAAVGRGTFVVAGTDRDRGAGAQKMSGPLPGSMPWTSLLSPVAAAEPLSRAGRLGRTMGKDPINLSRMQPSPDLLPDEMLRRCLDHVMRVHGPRALSYAPPDGLPPLRQLIAEDLVRQGVPARAEDILITTGSQQGLDLVARALISPGDSFLVDPTTYVGAINLLTVAGARLVAVPSDGEGPDPAALSRLGRTGAKGLYLMPNCHNPTGACISAARRQDLSAWSREHSVPLIEDDYGADLSLEGRPLPAALRALDGDVIHMGTFSKKLAPALRIGFLLCPAALRPTLLALKHAMDLGTSALLQYVLAEFLDRGYLRAHLSRTLPEYRRRRDALVEGLLANLPAGLSFRTPEHGLVLWLPLPEPLSPDLVFEEAQRHGVLVSPGTLQAVDPRLSRGVRMTYCSEPPERIKEGARRLGEALRALFRRHQKDGPVDATAIGSV